MLKDSIVANNIGNGTAQVTLIGIIKEYFCSIYVLTFCEGYARAYLANITFVNNTNLYEYDWKGAALHVSSADVLVEDCVFQNNIAPRGSAFFNRFEGHVNCTRCTFVNNIATNGSVIQLEQGKVKFEDSSVSNSIGGGAHLSANARLMLYNTTFTNNTSPTEGNLLNIMPLLFFKYLNQVVQ